MVCWKTGSHLKKKCTFTLHFFNMEIINSFFIRYKPGVPRRYLLLVAAFVWTFAGGMLLFRGISILKFNSLRIDLEESGSVIAGLIFYKFMFSAISMKHIHRILNLQVERPCIFSFFNWRSYIMMTMMMTFGITLRVSGIIPINYLSLFYIAMGTPLFISAIRFYKSSVNYQKALNKSIESGNN